MDGITLTAIVGASVMAGVGLTFGVAYGIDAYHSWRYHFRNARELRERPKVPFRVDRIELSRSDDRWMAYAYDRNGHRIGYETDTHPMDAVRNLLNWRMVQDVSDVQQCQ